MSISIDFIKAKIQANNYELSIHAHDERINDEIEFAELEEALLSGEIIEDYPNDPRGASCLVLGYTKQNRPIHIVCGTKRGNLILITIYVPQKPKWRNPRTRNR